MAVAMTASPSTSAQSAKALLDVNTTLPRSYLAEISAKSAVAARRSHGHTPNSSITSTFGAR
jgi:hypothetical protein